MEFIKTEDLEIENYSIRKILISNSSAANALSLEVIDELEKSLYQADKDNKVRVIILTGEGKFFSAGGDIKRMQNKEGMFSGEGNELRENYKYGIQRLPLMMESLETPIIAMINGPAVGAGCDLSCMCDFRLAKSDAVFSVSFTKIGLIPGDGGTYFLPRIVGLPKATEMILTGDKYSGSEVVSMGLVHSIFESGKELEVACYDLAKRIAKNSPMAVSMAKRALRHSLQTQLTTQLDLLNAYQGICQTSNDHQEGLRSLFDRNSPSFNRE